MNTFFLGHGAIKSANGYRINLYRYGELWKIIRVESGTSVIIGSCDVAYDDDTFYGWSTTGNSATRTYTSTSRITPTTDINLYAIFSYRAALYAQTTVTRSVTLSTTAQTTIEITDAVIGTPYSITTTTNTPKSTSTVVVGSSTSPGYTLYNIENVVSTQSYGTDTTFSTTISYTFNKYSYTNVRFPVGSVDAGATPTFVTRQSPSSVVGNISYIALRLANSKTYYRVASHDELSVLNLYRYGQLYLSVEMQEGLSFTVGKLNSEYDDDTFYGWSLSPDSTTRTYRSGSSVAPRGELNLYAIYSYVSGQEMGYTYSSISSGSTTYNSDTIKSFYSGNISASASYTTHGSSAETSMGVSWGYLPTSGAVAYVSSRTVSAGGNFTVGARGTGNTTTILRYSYPSGYVDVISQRVISHD